MTLPDNSRLTRMTHKHTAATAIAIRKAEIAELRAQLDERLAAYEATLSAPNWKDAGTLSHVAEIIEQAVAALPVRK